MPHATTEWTLSEPHIEYQPHVMILMTEPRLPELLGIVSKILAYYFKSKFQCLITVYIKAHES